MVYRHHRLSRVRGSRARVTPWFRGSAALGLHFGLLCAAANMSAANTVFRVNLGSFTGDSQLASAVADTLLTDLAKSGRISVLSGTEAAQAEGSYVLTGSCIVYDGNVVINVRLLDSSTGRSLPGAAENIEGPKSQVFSLVHGLAGKLTARVTGDTGVSAVTVRKPQSTSMLPQLKGLGLPAPHLGASILLGTGHSTTASSPRPRSPIVARQVPAGTNVPEVGTRVEPDTSVDNADQGSSLTQGIDAAQIDRGETADPVDVAPRVARGSSAHNGSYPKSRAARYTSLIIDARGLGLDRSMSPSIRRTDGSVVWNGAEANPDYVISDGIVAYATTMREARDLARTGSRPLIIEAVSRHETPFPSDPYIDDEDAEYILRTGRQDGFLKDFRVIFVIGR